MASEIDIGNRKVPKTQENDTGSNHVVPVMLTFYDSDLKTVKERSRSKFRGLVVSDLVGGSFQPIFRVSHFGLRLFWPKSESDNVCIIICV